MKINLTMIFCFAIIASLSAYCFYIASHNNHNGWIYFMGFAIISGFSYRSKNDKDDKTDSLNKEDNSE